MQRLKIKAQFQAAMAGHVVAKTAHFALHRLVLAGLAGAQVDAADAAPPVSPLHSRAAGSLPDALPAASQKDKPRLAGAALFAGPGVWMGALVPKRWARCAVTRNAIRRQIYAVAQDRAEGLVPAAYVVRLRQGFERTRFVSASSECLRAAVRQELQQLFDRHPGRGSRA